MSKCGCDLRIVEEDLMYDCHGCHDGQDVDELLDDTKVCVYKSTAEHQFDSDVETTKYTCSKCKTKYFHRSEVSGGGAGFDEWKEDKCGLETDSWY